MRALESGDAEATRTAVQGHFAYVRTDRYREHTERSFREARTAAARQLSSQAGPPRANR